ncbi:MAG: PilZ domain-containing protein, partial [Vogesella sp.]
SNISSGLYITQTNAKKGQRVFLIPKRLADNGRELTFAANGKSYPIRILHSNATFEDCQQVEFETLERL